MTSGWRSARVGHTAQVRQHTAPHKGLALTGLRITLGRQGGLSARLKALWLEHRPRSRVTQLHTCPPRHVQWVGTRAVGSVTPVVEPLGATCGGAVGARVYVCGGPR